MTKMIIRVDVYRGYSIERERDGTYSAYSIANSMYEVHTGFKTTADAKVAVDGIRDSFGAPAGYVSSGKFN